MKFISEDPNLKYTTINYNKLSILLNVDDVNPLTIQKAEAFCDKHNYSLSDHLTFQVFYLRGHRHKGDYDKILVGILEVDYLPAHLFEIVHCLAFWNQEGVRNYEMNKARNESYQDFILRGIAADCRAFTQEYDDLYCTGNGGNHVWIADKSTKQRILIIHF